MTYDARYEDYRALLMKLSHRAVRVGHATNVPIEFDDAMQEANITYLKACEGFDPAFGVKFSTYLWQSVTRNLRRMQQQLSDVTRGNVSIDAELGDDMGSLHDLLADESIEPIDEAIQRRERESANFARLSRLAQKVVSLLDSPSPELVRELRRQEAFREECKRCGFAAPAVKLDTRLICRVLGYDEKTRRKIEREFLEIMQNAGNNCKGKTV